MEGGAIGRAETSLVGGPEPTVDVLREEVGPVAAVKVTQAARGPEVGHVACVVFCEFETYLDSCLFLV